MAYQVNKFNGELLVSVPDGALNTTTDLRLVGKNYAGYGEVQNENLIFLLENFSNTTPPPRAIRGQLWYDTQNRKLKITHNGSDFKVVGGATVSPAVSPPVGLAPGEFWWNSTARQLFAWDGNEFELIGPDISPDEVDVVRQTVEDTEAQSQTIIRFVAGGETIAIGSSQTFTLATTVDGFSDIKQGITLRDADQEFGLYRFWGKAADSERLGGIDADQYVLRGSESFTGTISFANQGIRIGEQPLKIFYDPPSQNAIVELVSDDLENNIEFRLRGPFDNLKRSLILTRQSIQPGDDAQFNVGAPDFRYGQVYAVNVNATLTGNVTGNITGVHRGNVLANDESLLINAETKVIGGQGIGVEFVGNLTGNVAGSLDGVAEFARVVRSQDGDFPAKVTNVPNSIPVRDATGKLDIGGAVDFADRLKVDDSADVNLSTVYRPAMTTRTGNTIAARTAAGNLKANLFEGTATSARYADLAEKYLTDKQYRVGTVMMVGGTAEVTASTHGNRAIGVISETPAFMMNAELPHGTYVALKGRVPVRVVGPVSKGDPLIATDNGCATVCEDANCALVFAIALEQSNDHLETLIESVIL